MDAVEFIKTVNRVCHIYKHCYECPYDNNGQCPVCRLARYGIDADKIVGIAEQWAKDHPVKTRQSEFLKMFPNARIDDSGVIIFCPKDFLPVGARSTYCEKYENCKECRKDYWLTEVTDND